MGDEERIPAELQAIGLEWLRKAEVADADWERSLFRQEMGSAEHEAAHSARLAAYAQLAQANFQAANIALLLRLAGRNPTGALDLTVIGDPTHG